jgi:hypothetical protein
VRVATDEREWRGEKEGKERKKGKAASLTSTSQIFRDVPDFLTVLTDQLLLTYQSPS